MGPDMVKAIKFSFEIGQLIGGSKATVVTLVPKVEAPNSVKYYRPINAFTKILANRIQVVLPMIIGANNQTVFVKGRSIMDMCS